MQILKIIMSRMTAYIQRPEYRLGQFSSLDPTLCLDLPPHYPTPPLSEIQIDIILPRSQIFGGGRGFFGGAPFLSHITNIHIQGDLHNMKGTAPPPPPPPQQQTKK
jgi:hypothetical protein